jgi:hypothetical protein
MAKLKTPTIEACSMRAADQNRLRNVEATKQAYRDKAAEADEARRLADRGEGHYRREYILREEAVLIANDLNYVMNKIPGILLNGCRDESLKAAWKHSMTIRTLRQNAFVKADSELTESKRLLQKVEQDLDRFFPDGWKKVVGADGIWRPKLTREFNENMRDELERSAVTLQHSLQILQRVADDAAAELDAATAAYDAAREALINSPI